MFSWGPCSAEAHRASAGRASLPGLCPSQVHQKVWSSTPGLRDMFLNFTVDVDVTKQRQRLQCEDSSSCQSCLRKWNGGSSLCENFWLISAEEVSREFRHQPRESVSPHRQSNHNISRTAKWHQKYNITLPEIQRKEAWAMGVSL